MLILQNFEKHELFCENMNFLTKFCEQLAKPIWQHWNLVSPFPCDGATGTKSFASLQLSY